MILMRLHALLKTLQRRFEVVRETRAAPRGAIRWSEYAINSIPKGKFSSVPCAFPELRDDISLKGAIRFALERHLRSLQTQLQHGSHIHKLVDLCNFLLESVRAVAPLIPSPTNMQRWQNATVRNDMLRDGIQAIA
jgi:hypothetical protein